MIQPRDVQVTTARATDWSGLDARSTPVMNDRYLLHGWG